MINQFLTQGTQVFVPEGKSMYVAESPVWVGGIQCEKCTNLCDVLSRNDQIAILVFCNIACLYVFLISFK